MCNDDSVLKNGEQLERLFICHFLFRPILFLRFAYKHDTKFKDIKNAIIVVAMHKLSFRLYIQRINEIGLKPFRRVAVRKLPKW